MAHATLLSNGRIVDGTPRPGWVGDLLIEGDHITALAAPGQIDPAALARARACEHFTEMDCTGRVIAPGFIDVHTHDDGIVLKGVENTIATVGKLARIGMEQTDKEIIHLMMEA